MLNLARPQNTSWTDASRREKSIEGKEKKPAGGVEAAKTIAFSESVSEEKIPFRGPTTFRRSAKPCGRRSIALMLPVRTSKGCRKDIRLGLPSQSALSLLSS